MLHPRACALGVSHLPQSPNPPAVRRAAGFTLIELMVTVAVIAILLSIGVPAMQNFLTARAVVSQTEELAATLRLARSDALRLNSRVTVCASASTADSSPTCTDAEAADWNTGWLTFIDVDGDGSRDVAKERLLRVQSPLNSVKAITSDDGGYVQFFPNGLPATGAASFEIQPKLESTDASYNTMLRRIELNSAGRAAIFAGPAAS